jgi:hypothetical protein
MERTSTFIKVWFWPRHASDVPSDVRNGNSNSVNTDAWGTPTANFPDTQCDINSKFAPAGIVINLTFCEFPLVRIGCQKLSLAVSRWRLGGRCLWLFGMPGNLRGYVASVVVVGLKRYGSTTDFGQNPDYVNNNPGAFSDAYFEFNSLRVYQ